MKQNINKKILALVAIVIIAAIIAVTVVLLTRPNKQEESANQAAITSEVIDNEAPQDVINYTATSTGSALDQLKALNDSVIVVDSEMGSYVDSINGLKGGTDGKYWSFYVDNEMAAVGAGQFMPKGGEKIEWKFQKL